MLAGQITEHAVAELIELVDSMHALADHDDAGVADQLTQRGEVAVVGGVGVERVQPVRVLPQPASTSFVASVSGIASLSGSSLGRLGGGCCFSLISVESTFQSLRKVALLVLGDWGWPRSRRAS